MDAVRTTPGSWRPLGANPAMDGTNFALYAAHAEAVELCLFDESGNEHRTPLRESTFHVWHAAVPGVGPGQRYGFRVHGPFDPARGLRFNPHKLLIDPYAKAIDGDVAHAALLEGGAVFGYPPGGPDDARDDRDSAAAVPKSIVVDDTFDWGDDVAPGTAWSDTVVYEVHVKGFTARHPDVPEHLRGTFAGLAHPAAVRHLRDLGVSAVELLPVHHYVSEPAVVRRGLSNYWGYNTLGFFAPHARYSSSGTGGEQVREFKTMVKTLHEAGIEVILDVVYNHTAEGDEWGPTLGLRGIDNPTYYRLRDGRWYENYTGTGNSVDTRNAPTLALVMDSLRYWTEHMHVDGFRFDLATVLARGDHGVDRASSFFAAVAQDPVLSRVKLIAEPWDAAAGGYQVGRFPPPWSEWNDRFRDTIRTFWMHSGAPGEELRARLTGSADLYGHGRRPFSSVNFVTSHDGFTLRDLVSYQHRRNEVNGEGNLDGMSSHHNWNFGVEGETTDPLVLNQRHRAVRNLLATLLLVPGTPMLGHGDELGRTQHGNNNAYCQDNAISYIDWQNADADLVTFVSKLVAVRRAHPVLRPAAFADAGSVTWYGPDGEKLGDDAWRHWVRTLGMFAWGEATRERAPDGRRILDDSFLLLMHAGDDPIGFTLPASAVAYEVVLTTGDAPDTAVRSGDTLQMTPRSLTLLQATT